MPVLDVVILVFYLLKKKYFRAAGMYDFPILVQLLPTVSYSFV